MRTALHELRMHSGNTLGAMHKVVLVAIMHKVADLAMAGFLHSWLGVS